MTSIYYLSLGRKVGSWLCTATLWEMRVPSEANKPTLSTNLVLEYARPLLPVPKDPDLEHLVGTKLELYTYLLKDCTASTLEAALGLYNQVQLYNARMANGSTRHLEFMTKLAESKPGHPLEDKVFELRQEIANLATFLEPKLATLEDLPK